MDRQPFKYYVTINTTTTEVFPLVGDSNVNAEFSEELIEDVIWKLDDIVFQFDDYDLINAASFDTKITLTLRAWFDNYTADWQQFQFSKNDGQWNQDDKVVKFQSVYAGVYKKILDNWENEENIFGVPGRKTIGSFVYSTYEFEVVYDRTLDPTTQYELLFEFTYNPTAPPPLNRTVRVYGRNRIDIFDDDPSWVEIEEGEYARPWSSADPNFNTKYITNSAIQ